MYQAAIQSWLSKNNQSKIDLKAVLIDMDGVLFDSMPVHVSAWTQTFKDQGLNFTEEEGYLHEGRTGSGTIHLVYQRELGRKATSEEIHHVYTRKSDLFDSHPESPIMPGALDLLNQLEKNNLKRILVTGSGQKALLSKMNLFFPGHFVPERMVTAYDVTKGKPDPEPYLQGLHKAGIEASNAIVIENAPLGVEAAKAAGIFTIAVNTGKLSDHHLWDAGADLLFHGMPALNQAWPELYKAFCSTTRI